MPRVPVCFTLDNLGDAADLFRGRILEPRPAGSNYALEVGVPSLLALFERHAVPLTYFVEGWSAERYPGLLRDFVARGHRIGMHGWQHEIWHLLDPHEIDELGERATHSITRACGTAPTAFRAPGGQTTAHTQQLLARLGYEIDASFAESPQPRVVSDTLVQLPYAWSGVDATHWLWHKASLEQAWQQWQQALEQAVAAGTPYIFIFHSHVMGMQPARLAIGARVLQQVLADPRLEVVSLAELRLRTLASAAPTTAPALPARPA